jgi:hypothetical protein
MELKWYNQLIFNMWLNMSSSFTIIWIIFRVYLHLVHVLFFRYIIFSYLISINLKKIFWKLHHLAIELPYFEYTLQKHLFNINLVKIENCTILKNNNYGNIFWSNVMCFHLFISHEKKFKLKKRLIIKCSNVIFGYIMLPFKEMIYMWKGLSSYLLQFEVHVSTLKVIRLNGRYQKSC